MTLLLYVLFVLSGAAGLIYESIWTRYLGLFVGHDAYAQIIVLVIFLGGMSVGAMAVSRRSERLTQPLQGYLIVEFLVGGIGLIFHDVYGAATSWAYQTVFPALAGGWTLTAAKWGIAGALILPQSILLGATFPLMSAGVLRLASRQPGRTLAVLYFANSLGAAGGVLLAGFWLIELAGLPGTLIAAATLNLVVALGTVFVVVRARSADTESPHPEPATSTTTPTPAAGAAGTAYPAPVWLLLFASCATAVASFIYEIGWVRMLALVLGSATHSFELMLSAFILGLALGAWWLRTRADRLADPVRTLGLVQWTMGFLALATLPLYVKSFDWISVLLKTFAHTDAGYTGFTAARYGICLAVMLPATFCAGMTLPLITRILLAGGAGERAIGAVYSWNTLGSIVGVILAGLILLPTLGLKGLLIAGTLVDMAVGVLLLARRPRLGWAAGLATVAVGGIAIVSPRLDPVLLASGVFRTGSLGEPSDRQARFYADGRTATVTGIRYMESGLLALSTNGKPDASLMPAWFRSCDSVAKRQSLVSDGATQTLLPLVTLAHAPRARSAAVIGYGSGMSSHLLLSSPHLVDLTTIEIEPKMVEGAYRTFYPANRRAFEDPRSHLVIDDAKSYFASARRRYDLIMSEPSNPWVSGVSGLFTTEFYARLRQYLTEDGVFGQWLHVYELDDGLVLNVLAAIHRNFPSYEIYLVPQGDLLVVASNRPALPAPDWSVIDRPDLRRDLCHFIPPTPTMLGALRLVGRRELAPLLDDYGQPNSDFYPILDLGAERRRFRRDNASGFPALAGDWFNLLSSINRRPTAPGGEPLPTFPQNPRLHASAVATYLRSPSAAGTDKVIGPALQQAEYQWQAWQAGLSADRAPNSWALWVDQAGVVQRLRNGGGAGQIDEELYSVVLRFLDRHHAPDAARDVVAFRHGVASWDFAEAARVADRLAALIQREPQWIGVDELRDGSVFAKLHQGDVAGARRLLDTLGRQSGRGPGDLRNQLLEAYVARMEKARRVAAATTTP